MTEARHGEGIADSGPSPRGIFDCDDAYQTPVREDYVHLFAAGMVVLDTNVLLNLYRSNERTRKDTFAVLSKLRDRLWVPHQVLSEFWRNRDLPSVRGHHRTKAKDACTALDKAHRSLSDALDRWLRDVHLFNDSVVREHVNRDKDSVETALNSLKSFIQDQAERDALKDTSATQSDPVLTELDGLLQGRIGAPFSETTLISAYQEAKKRADARIPPGYEDFKDKPTEQAAGDYLLWAQILDEAERRRSDVLLVTGDVKADWWVPGSNQLPARPRTELVAELRNRATTRLYMLTPSQLLTQANEVFNLRVDERSVSDLATTENDQTDPRSYNRAVELTLRQHFPEAQILNLDEQMENFARTPIPDITLMYPNWKIGIEVKNKRHLVNLRDVQYLQEMIEEHGLQAVLIVSNMPLSSSAKEHLQYLSGETAASVSWLRIHEEYITELAGVEALRSSIENATGAPRRNASQ
ncbi:PIN-like domain-containing protein [Streptomyces massasporeus]|uniref:PIN-like domain-containing protein n=1 Tax=Streptomyces massasporeus TaxID=67324 RepID=UPI00368A4A2B